MPGGDRHFHYRPRGDGALRWDQRDIDVRGHRDAVCSKAAVAAGMRVLGFTGGGHCGPGHANRLREAGASEVFDDMRNLQDFLI